MPINHKVFLAAFDTIKKIASEGPCVMIGRCADYALADNDNVVNFFLYAPLDARIERVQKRMNLTNDKAKDFINKTDKQRASYYNYYSTKKWGTMLSYDYSLDTSILGIDGTVEIINHIVDKI
jgi:cytidylate kinase